MAQSKPLFIPWLRQQIDSGRFPGVHWVNQDHTLFCIPWKHALRQDANSDDVLIFKAWAQTNVGSVDKIHGDPSVWKRNFRSALRAKHFKLEVDSKNDSANPHKIFRWPEETHSSGESKEGSQDCDIAVPICDSLYLADDKIFRDGSTPPNFLEHCLMGLDIGPNQDDQKPEMDHLLFLDQPVGGGQYPEMAIPEVPLLSQTVTVKDTFPTQETITTSGAAGGVLQTSPAEGTLALSQFSPLEGAFAGEQYHTEEPVMGDQVTIKDTPSDSCSNQFSTHYKVVVYYKGSRVFDKVVENEAGFRIVCRNRPCLMSDSLSVVELPTPDSILDQTQARLTMDILTNLGGLEVRRSGGILLGHRWGDSRVYWGQCKHEQGKRPRALSKNQPECIYSLREFCMGLKEFIDNNGGSSPSYSLFFCLGEKWPDPKNKPWDKKLITVEVVLTTLERLKMLAVDNGASSLNSVELQLSLEQMMEIC
ncbi:hypothetical protein P4O66_011221 [Electrophorus voltai]|uniref:IRF tryptophan pentad repeat domain-containing protein n=1 Tax=Electrophorus voltai TaxID=2609070 RepID=A0AAD9DUD5_9TELE|nr:hypothetical protein P4O66_011221 [Electrophorus voltai]